MNPVKLCEKFNLIEKKWKSIPELNKEDWVIGSFLHTDN